MRGTFRPWLVLVTFVALVVSGVAAVLTLRGADGEGGEDAVLASSATCARGYEPVESALAEVRAEMRTEREGEDTDEAEEYAEREEAGEAEQELVREASREIPMLQDTDPDDWDSLCIVAKRPESLAELNALFNTQAVARLAPFGAYKEGAALNASRQAEVVARRSVPGTSGTASSYGRGPLIVDDPRYPEVNGLGLHDNSGRVDGYAYDDRGDRVFAAVGSGGIWRSDDLGGTWRNATGNLPTTITGAVGWSRHKGGTLIALTGEPTFGSSAYTGLGAYWSGDLGKTWKRSRGVPSGALGFAVAVDPARPSRVYAGTQRGLFVSTDGGRSYRNADLPTGQCAGVTDVAKRPECALANTVTDVVVRQPGGVSSTPTEGSVVASVGWRGGQRKNRDGTVQSPRNGIYRSSTGDAGSFRKLQVNGFADQDAIGRTELGQAVGPRQDHDILYAMVQDANLLNNGGAAGIDVPEGTNPPVGGTVLNGLYVSTDFGKNWRKLASGTSLAADPTTGSALVGTGTAVGYQPGVQAWYNQWIQPDPSRADANGVPTRLGFGLEEIWTNEAPEAGQPLDGSTPVHFKVVGKYFGGQSCLLLKAGLPTCPGDREPTDDNSTTHPDQQEGLWVLDDSAPGGVQLLVGNDGGAYRYRFENDDDGELDNSHWGPGDQKGFNTLLPYVAVMANDGTVYGGLQDNGNMKIEKGTRKQYETYGGDGFFSAVDPADSDITYEEYTNAAISVSTDGGSSWRDIDPGLSASKFSNPFVMDPQDANHLVTAGREVVETLVGPSTSSGMTDASDADQSTDSWIKVFDLGTRSAPGDGNAEATSEDPANSMSAVATQGDASYVGFCGHCDTLNKPFDGTKVFKSGLATNVGGDAAPAKGTAAGWHIAAARGLPNRYITSLAVDPDRPRTVFVTLGGYTRRWLPPGATGDTNPDLGTGHLYVSRNGGQSFTDRSGNLPDSPATWVTLRGDQLLVGTDVGAFASTMDGASRTSPTFGLMKGLQRAPVSSITLKPDDYDRAVVAQMGRGVWTYDFDNHVAAPPPSSPTAPQLGTPVASYDFESDAQGWTTGGTPTWRRSAPGHGSGTEEASEGRSFGIVGPTEYVDGMDATLTSPAVTLAEGRSVVQFAIKQDTESYDPVTLEWSSNGSDWKSLATYAGQSDGFPGWTTYDALLPSPGGEVTVRFHFTSDAFCSGGVSAPLICADDAPYDGVRIDDVKLGPAA